MLKGSFSLLFLERSLVQLWEGLMATTSQDLKDSDVTSTLQVKQKPQSFLILKEPYLCLNGDHSLVPTKACFRMIHFLKLALSLPCPLFSTRFASNPPLTNPLSPPRPVSPYNESVELELLI